MLGVGGEYRELVPAQARESGGCAQHAAQPCGDFLQQGIASVVAERVVDVLEAIEIEEQNAEHVLVAPGGQQRLAQPVSKEAPVGESRERVVECLILQGIGL